MQVSLGETEREFLKPVQDLPLVRLKPASKRANSKIRIASWALLFVGLSLTVVIAILGTDPKGGLAVLPAVALTVSSGLFQVMSVVIGNRAGKLDANHVRGLARISLQLQSRVGAARILAEEGYTGARNASDRATLGKLSLSLSQIEDHLVESVETWRDLNPEVFQEGQIDGQD